MIDIKTFQDQLNLQQPKRLMKYILIWCSKGSVNYIIDDKEFSLLENQLITITSGQVHYLTKYDHPQGFILEFTLDFFCKDDEDIELIFHNGLFCHFAMNEVITIAKSNYIECQLSLIREELQHKPYQYLTSIRARIELILVEINRAKVCEGKEIYKPDALFLKFLELVRNNFKNNLPLNYYAELLGTTASKLNEQSKLHTGKTAQNVIYGLIVSEAKRLLRYQNTSIKEVAHQLGFDDPFYFSNFFKKHSQESPKSYKLKQAF